MSYDIAIIAIGSTGDVVPLAALADGLQRSGEKVRFITHHSFQSLTSELDLKFFPIAGNYRDFFQSSEGLRLVNNRQLPWQESSILAKELPTQLREALDAANGSDAIIVGPLSIWGYHIAEILNIPLIVTSYCPIQSTRYFPFLQFGIKQLKPVSLLEGIFNKFSYQVSETLFWIRDQEPINRFRESQGLPAISLLGPRLRWKQPDVLSNVLVLNLYSEVVLPSPADWEADTNPTFTTGYCFPRHNPYSPPKSLVDFIGHQSDLPLISIGFGSMPLLNPNDTFKIIVEAVKIAHVRAVLVSGWGNLKGFNSPYLYQIESVPYSWLFPQVSAVVHHGGAGTTSLGLRAGKPTVVVPFFADQHSWAKRLKYLGVSPEPIPAKILSAQRLAERVGEAVSCHRMLKNAREISDRIHQENGVEMAASLIRNYLNK